MGAETQLYRYCLLRQNPHKIMFTKFKVTQFCKAGSGSAFAWIQIRIEKNSWIRIRKK